MFISGMYLKIFGSFSWMSLWINMFIGYQFFVIPKFIPKFHIFENDKKQFG